MITERSDPDRGDPDRGDPGPKVAAHHRGGTGLARIPYPIGVRTAPVSAITDLGPRMRRITLCGPGLAGFPTHHFDDHVKIIFPGPDGVRRDPVPNRRQMLDWPRPLPPSRSYTVRRHDPVRHEIDLDFVLHDGGLASTWVRGVTVGEPVTIAGPPGAKTFPLTYARYLFAVDGTALPAVARWLDESPVEVRAHVVIADEVPGYPLTDREHVTVVHDELASITAQTGTFLFAAGEAGALKPLRAWSRGRLDHMITGYWKHGVADHDDH
ncbi:siderophore-interacting protein [Actinoplanes sp. G11-F43]|uniref:siderophore-interacting protein n=1 Tax=Actinoplanes sp. G11-F43 TaxID=3424130 RepID=UPI003D34DAB0